MLGKVVLMLLAVEAGTVEDGSRFLPSRRVLGRAITGCAVNGCAIKAGAVKASSGILPSMWVVLEASQRCINLVSGPGSVAVVADRAVMSLWF